MNKIHEYIVSFKEYIHNTMKKMDHYLSYSELLSSHGSFNEILNEKRVQLSYLYEKLDKIGLHPFSVFSIGSWNKIFEIGYTLKCFYEFYENPFYHDLMEYSFEFHLYLECLEGLQENILGGQMNFAEFYSGKDKQKEKEKEKGKQKGKKVGVLFKDNYYGVLKDRKPIKNDVSLNKNLIITGPNASGKTTVLKSVLINILLSQQFGCGFYETAHLNPYDHIHCYLNIPDTSGRDSLFQAEARRCKEIIDIIHLNPNDNHFCVFDELYSGTNPEEAVSSASAFMNYLAKFKSVNCLLTTHFFELCKNLEMNSTFQNFHMETTNDINKKFSYTYLLKKGISSVRGGIKVLEDMGYPTEIILNSSI
jgi:hypothetical protein